MRSEKQFDRRKTFYALRKYKFGGRVYERGDKFPHRDVTNTKLKILFQNGRIGYAEDFKDNKVDRKPVTPEGEGQNDSSQESTPEVANEEEQEANESEKAQVVQDDEEAFRVTYKGKTFEINRNQLREDGTLTAGGMKAYEKAE